MFSERGIEAWTPADEGSLWELSGLHEGDIMVHPEGRGLGKNGLIDPDARWPRGIVPYHVQEGDFGELSAPNRMHAALNRA